MKRLSRIAALLFVSALLVSVAGCKGKTVYMDANGQPTDTPPASAVEASQAPAESAAGDTGETTESSAETAESQPAEESTEEAPAESSEEAPAESSVEESSEEAAQESSEAEDTTNYIYFDNSELKWEKVCATWWNDMYDNVTNKITGELYPAAGEDGKQDLRNFWPGAELEKVGDSDIYRCAVPVGATKIIFNSGISDDDIKAGTDSYQTADLDFSDSDNAGQVYKVDTSVEAKAGRGIEKTKYRYSDGSWTAYSG